jgi:hypothetical protein
MDSGLRRLRWQGRELFCVESAGGPAEDPMEWRFWRLNQWERYDLNTSMVLETALAAGSKSVTFTLDTTSSAQGRGTCEYQVFMGVQDAFEQHNLRTGHVRAVRRAPASTFQRQEAPELQAPRLEPLVTAAVCNNATLQLHGGTFSVREELSVGKGMCLKIIGPGKIFGSSMCVCACNHRMSSLKKSDCSARPPQTITEKVSELLFSQVTPTL